MSTTRDWDEIKSIEGSDENVIKFVFEAKGNKPAIAEAVLYKYPTYQERTVICCSTMSGCPMGCSFCGSGKFHVRNLTSMEIVSQVDACIEHAVTNEGRLPTLFKKFQIMFMSMGEPLLNWKQLKPALVILHDKYPTASLLISTSAPNVPEVYKELSRLSCEIPNIGLQFSIHESTDIARNLLIPFKYKLSLEGISKWGEYWYKHTQRKPYFNYCVHTKNNSEGDAQNLLELFNPSVWEATLSVICESDESVASSIERQEQLATGFSSKLLNLGFNTRVFNPAGQDDIGGGCGQLWHVQDWVKKNPSNARKSCGGNK